MGGRKGGPVRSDIPYKDRLLMAKYATIWRDTRHGAQLEWNGVEG